MITEQQKQYLQAAGYEVESMTPHGPEWVGFWRWIHPMYGPDAEPQESEQEAWDDALSYQAQVQAYEDRRGK